MILNDFQCESCQRIFERLVDSGTDLIPCDICGNGTAHRIISTFRGGIEAEYPSWLRDTLEVVDKGSNKPHVKQFLADPSRTNYKAWMKGEGIRHLETGESRSKDYAREQQAIHERATKYAANRLVERRRIEI